MSSVPPQGCPECEAKIVLDGSSASSLIEATCEAAQHFFSTGGQMSPEGFKAIIAKLNELETGAIELQKIFLHQIHYKGDVPPHLKQ